MNWDIWGHDWAVNLLQQHIVEEKVRHAYLFTGPRGIGRRTLALRFAQALNCKRPISPGEPCLECRTCQQIQQMQHPDLTVLQAEKEGGSLKVEMVRDIQHMLALHPYDAQFRIALFLRFQEATTHAMNALLKTLEEPPPQVVILITAESVDSLLPTIVSRCEVIRLRPVKLDQINSGLHDQLKLPDEEARFLAHVSDGKPGYAVRLHEQPDILEQRSAWLDDLSCLLRSSRVDRFAFAATFLDGSNGFNRFKFREMIIVWLTFWRDVMLRSAGTECPIANIDRKEEIEAIAGMLSLAETYRIVSSLEHSMELLKKNVNGRLLAEVVMLDLPYINS
jgi:DNA polymerase-3 subunit delta'